MVTFMEQHGYLSKLLCNARGRISNYNKWEQLTQLVNSHGSGCTKTKRENRKNASVPSTTINKGFLFSSKDTRKEEVQSHGIISPSRPTSPSQILVAQPAPVISGQTTPCHMRVCNRTSPQQRLRPTHIEQTQHFLQAKESQQHQHYMDLRTEKTRIREMEVETQRLWHTATVASSRHAQ